MKRFLFFFLITLLTKGVAAQKLNTEFIHNWIISVDKTFEPKDEYDLYVINGVLIQNHELTAELSKYDILNDRITIDYLDKQQVSSNVFIHRPFGTVFLIMSHNDQRKKKWIKEQLREFRMKIPKPTLKTHHINDTLKQPVLLIDGTPIHHTEASEVLANLKVRDIFNMAYTSKAPVKYYGQNAKNGLIQIWLKEGRKL